MALMTWDALYSKNERLSRINAYNKKWINQIWGNQTYFLEKNIRISTSVFIIELNRNTIKNTILFLNTFLLFKILNWFKKKKKVFCNAFPKYFQITCARFKTVRVIVDQPEVEIPKNNN